MFALIATMMFVGCGEEVPELNLEMMPIPSGTFLMGGTDYEEGWDDDEGPQTTVTITKPFWLGKTEVTQSQWEAVMGNNPSRFKGDDLPMTNINWHDAVDFCEKLNAIKHDTLPDGYRYTLPTEAQWEYACRAGTTTRFCYGDDYNQLGQYAWNEDNSSDKTHPVGEKQPNDWGLHDMHGNVWEWCLDGYSDSYLEGSVSDPQNFKISSFQVVRGGSWFSIARYCRSLSRSKNPPNRTRLGNLGFRIALSPVLTE
ncbi:formylglycine-generating enzyme family protein [Verrucomicrobia bacterium]|nr:formylglycine-generating enzyme family protein [Verrucomicrobiota bacterium]